MNRSCAQPPSYRFQVRKSRKSGENRTRSPSGDIAPAPDTAIGSASGSPPDIFTVYRREPVRLKPSRSDRNSTASPSGVQPYTWWS